MLDALLDLRRHRDFFAQNEIRKEGLARFPVQIERPLSNSRFPGDILHGCPVIAIAQDQVGGCIEDSLRSGLTPLPVRNMCAGLIYQAAFSLHTHLPHQEAHLLDWRLSSLCSAVSPTRVLSR